MDSATQGFGVDQREQGQWASSVSASELIEQATGFLRRRYPLIVLVLVAAISLGFVVLLTSPSYYTANARLLIDTGFLRSMQTQHQQIMGDFSIDSAQVDTQIELLKSDKVGLSVIKAMKLTEDPEFVGRRTGLIGAIFGMISAPFVSSSADPKTTASEEQLTGMALGRFLSQRDVKRVARTYVLDISFTSLSVGNAAAIANGIADAYILDLLDSKYQATRRASTWLQDRIVELRQQALLADQKVLGFKEQKNIVGMGGGAGSDGRLLGEQQVIDVNSQLGQALAAKAEALARLDRIEHVIKQDIPDAAVADSLRNTIINTLRTQYLDYDRKYQLWSSRYGPDHLAAVNIKTQMNYLRQSMHNELIRIAESYKSDLAIATARVEALEKGLATLVTGTQATNRERLGLQELESSAKVYHSIHDSFLQRYMEMSQQLSFPMTEARVISLATSGGQSSPQPKRIFTMAIGLGLIMAFGLSLFREAIDRVFRTSQQVEKILKTNCLAVVPALKNVREPSVAPPQNRTDPANIFARSAKTLDANVHPILRYVVQEPLLAFTEAFRSIKVAVDISRAIKENKVIGVSSSLPNEGKSTVSSNLAELIAHGGNRVILVDGDLRNPTLSRRLTKNADVGLLEVLGRKVQLRDAIYTDEQTKLDFLPVVIQSHLAHSSDILASEAFRLLIDSLRKIYDYVVVDLSPLMPVVDVRATTKFVDSYLFVVEWGRTRISLVQRQFNSAPEVAERLLGVVLNKANLKALARYDGNYGARYYNSYYARYGVRAS